MKMRVNVLGIAAAAVALVGLSGTANASVTAIGPGGNNFAYFSGLTIPPGGAFDERGFASFQYLISGRDGSLFRRSDQFVINGEERDENKSLFNDLGGASDLSGTKFTFSLQHNLLGGRNFTFSLNEMNNGNSSVICWGQGCDAGSDISEPTTPDGATPFADFNVLQLQVRAQADFDILNPVAEVKITGLTGVDLAPGTSLFDETVIPTSPGTVLPSDLGRRGQWYAADGSDFTLNEWELTGEVTLSRDDLALEDLTKLRVKVDLAQDARFGFGEIGVIPIPGAVWLFGTGLVALLGIGRWRREQAV